MEDHQQWYDPLLSTDVSHQQQSSSQYTFSTHQSPKSSLMEKSAGVTWHPDIVESTISKNRNISAETNRSTRRSMFGFSLTAPDLVVCAGSPEIPEQAVGDFCPEFFWNEPQDERETSIVISLEEGINGLESLASMDISESPDFSSFWRLSKESDQLADTNYFDPVSAPRVEEMIQSTGLGLIEDTQNCEGMGDYGRLRKDYELQRGELVEAKKVIEELKRENLVMQEEYEEAWSSLKDLQTFAIEGQVKEKTKWFSCLRDLNRKLKLLKLEHIKVSEEALKYRNCLMELEEMKSCIQSALSRQADFNHKLQAKYVEGAKERRELYNKVLELKGNIRVFCRCRPLNTEEISMGASTFLDLDSAKDGEITVRSNGWPKKTYKFDAVFGPEANQEDVFEDTAPFASSVLDGYNVCILAYGQTGTGKTFTMEGTKEARGVNYRTLEELFRIVQEREKLFRYGISVSVLEVYNEQVRDLLATASQPVPAANRLKVRQVSEGMHHVPGLVEARVSNMSEVWDVLQSGSNARAVGSTSANEHSSRSHCIHCVMVKGENLLNGERTKSKLWLVDLAGSERIAKTEAQGERLREAQNINRSLSALGDVIAALATKSPHIPFRNSKLTHLLQDSLGGDSKALMFLHISPNENDVSETLCSLNFASRVKGIELGPARKQIDNTEFLRYKQMVERGKQDAKSKETQIKKMEENIHILEMKMKEREQKYKNLQEKVKELESQLLIERKLAQQHVDTKIAELQKQQMTTQQLEDQILAPTARLPTAAKTLANTKNNTSDPNFKIMNMPHPLTDHNIQKQSSAFPPEEITQLRDLEEKENNPQIVGPPLYSKRADRVSLCPTATRRMTVVTAARRNSLILLPTTSLMAVVQLPSSALPQPTDHNIQQQPLAFPPEEITLLRDLEEKENNPQIEPPLYSKKAGRVSHCPTATTRRMTMGTAARRNSLIPLPTSTVMAAVQLPSSALPLSTPPQEDKLRDADEVESNCMLPPAAFSPKTVKRREKKMNSIFRRSLQKKVMSPRQQQLRKGGLNVAEKVRVSIGSRGRMAHRVPYGNNRRADGKEFQKEKERGWNI